MERKYVSIIEGDFSSYLTLPEEKLLMAKRQHLFTLFIPILSTISISIMLLISSTLLLSVFSFSTEMITIDLVILLGALNVIAKMIIDWYFHLYIVTNRKILEVKYSYLASLEVNEVLLDQVRCTEVDTRTYGLIHSVINMGDVVLTFDRPTHEQEFVIRNIRDYRTVGKVLTNNLVNSQFPTNNNYIWYRSKLDPKNFSFAEQLYPKLSS